MKVKKLKIPGIKNNFHIKIKRLFSYIYAFSPIGYCLVYFHSLFHKKTKYKYECSLCLIFKNEAPYLKEWIEYHRLIGIEHFYLYNNNSDDNFRKVLDPYLNSSIVTLKDWTKNYAQAEAYQDCYSQAKKETHWLGFIDIDEFINLYDLKNNDIKQVLKKFRRYPSIHLFWKIFGTSGIMKENFSKTIIEQFTSCWPWFTNEGKHIINNDWNFNLIWIHWSKAQYFGFPIFPITDSKMFTPYMQVYPYGNYNPKIAINHYWTKSKTYAKNKVNRSSAAEKKTEHIRKMNGMEFFELKCAIKDFSIQRWLVLLKEQLNNYSNESQ